MRARDLVDHLTTHFDSTIEEWYKQSQKVFIRIFTCMADSDHLDELAEIEQEMELNNRVLHSKI